MEKEVEPTQKEIINTNKPVSLPDERKNKPKVNWLVVVLYLATIAGFIYQSRLLMTELENTRRAISVIDISMHFIVDSVNETSAAVERLVKRFDSPTRHYTLGGLI